MITLPITIISATPGPKTEETILDLILTHPQGLTVKELSQRLNRPVSMIQICLNSLLERKQVSVRYHDNNIYKVYCPYYVTMFN